MSYTNKTTTITSLTSCLIVGGGGISKVLAQRLLEQNCVVFLVDEGIDSAAITHLRQINKQKLFIFTLEDLLNNRINFENGLDYLFYLPTYFEKGLEIAQILLDLAEYYRAKFLLSSYEDFELRILSHYQVFSEYLRRSYIKPVKLIETLRLIESLVSQRSHREVVDARIVRSAFVYGPDLTSLESPLFYNLFYSLVQNNLKIVLPNDGMIEVFPTYVDDLVWGLVKAMFSQNSKGKMFGLISENKHSLLQFAYLLRQSAELPIQISFVSDTEGKYVLNVPSQVWNSQKSLGWYARKDFGSGLKKTIEPILPWLRQKAKQISSHPVQIESQRGLFSMQYSGQDSVEDQPKPAVNIYKTNPKPRGDYFEINQKYQTPIVSQPIPQQEEAVPILSEFLASKRNLQPNNQVKPLTTLKPNLERKISAPVVNTSVFQELVGFIFSKKSQEKSKPKVGKKFIFITFAVLSLILLFFSPNIITVTSNNQLRARFDKFETFLYDDNAAKSEKYIQELKGVYKVLNFSQKYLLWQENVFNIPVSKNLKQELKTDQVLLGVLQNVQQVVASSSDLYQVVMGAKPGESQKYLADIHSRLTKIYEDIGFWQAEQDSLDSDSISKKLLEIKDMSWQNAQTATLLAGFLNTNDKKTILVLIQDSQEIRPSGGFLEGVGLLFMDKGKILDYQSFDTYKLDSKLTGLVKPPEIVAQNLSEDHWWLRDANIFPDFTESAKASKWFVEKELEKNTDGVIAIDENFLTQILNNIGPIFLDDYNEQVNSKNLTERLQSHAEVNFFAGEKYKKPFLVGITDQIFIKLEKLTTQQMSDIGKSIFEALNAKSLQIWLPQTEVEDFIANNGWDGRLRESPTQLLKFGKVDTADYFAFYEANVGTNKVNYVVDRNVKQQLTFSNSGSLHKKITIDWQNNSQGDVWPLGNYKNLVQVLIPPIARDLRVAKIMDGKKTYFKTDQLKISTSGDKQSFQALIEVPPQRSGQLVIEYDLTTKVPKKSEDFVYGLYWQKQPGVNNLKHQTTVSYPQDWKLDKLTPQAQLGKQTLLFEGEQNSDYVMAVSFSL